MEPTIGVELPIGPQVRVDGRAVEVEVVADLRPNSSGEVKPSVAETSVPVFVSR